MKPTTGEKLFYGMNYIVLLLLGLSCLLPLVHILALSMSDAHSILSGKVSLLPVGFTMESFQSLFQGTRMMDSFKNSVVITVVGTALAMIVTVLTAYPLARKYFIGRRFFLLAFLFTMMFGGGTIPSYLVMKSLGIINTYWALWLPALVNTYNLLILRTFFVGLPEEVEDAARIDGCGEWRLLGSIVLPLSLPVLATLTLFNAVGFWNSFLSVLIYINDTHLYNLTVLVQNMIQSQSVLQEVVASQMMQADDTAQITPEGIKAAGIITLMAPMVIVYPFVQKYFVQGALLGSVKG
ncbi:carbohydrate ABC transporter permease [Paenibacillus arenilitoris]|uniref:Carbohydrate ABC transporter permease n=1 Tax=Paenibacillus arenilitoris TaxID=2772299 RepID=A0A927CHV2_9BACL|nr:carbohydrate ABC transporter permease [Paenibacillus arenilitoris]MBD2867327.1 carbohydrate ABC transporter permease [Paenibacillus arenilitoris]